MFLLREMELIKKIVAFLNAFMVYYCVTDLKVQKHFEHKEELAD